MDKSKKGEFQKEHIRLHKEWSAAVGTPGYDKQEFRDKERELHDKFREKMTNQSNIHSSDQRK